MARADGTVGNDCYETTSIVPFQGPLERRDQMTKGIRNPREGGGAVVGIEGSHISARNTGEGVVCLQRGMHPCLDLWRKGEVSTSLSER